MRLNWCYQGLLLVRSDATVSMFYITIPTNLINLKVYSVILIASFYRINQKILTKKRLFPKFQLILIFHLQVMHDYVH